MKIKQICDLLRQELYESGYEYGFYFDGRKYTPNMSNGFDSEFFNLFKANYRIQDPTDTMREKVGTCLDSVMVMRTILEKLDVPYKIWLIHHRVKKKEHTILTFDTEKRLIYLELTPQSNKPWYGQEILYDDEQTFMNEFQRADYDIVDITDKMAVGKTPDSLLECLNKEKKN